MAFALSTAFSNITISILIATMSMQLSNTMISTEQPAELSYRELYFSYVDEITSRDEYDFYPDIDKLVKAIMVVESDCQPNLTSSAGCIGLMQLSPYWQAERAKRLGVANLWDPYGNILVGIDFLKDLYFNYANQDMPLAIMMYNMDFSSARNIRSSGQLTGYAVKVLGLYNELKENKEIVQCIMVRKDNIKVVEEFINAKFIKIVEDEYLCQIIFYRELENQLLGDLVILRDGDLIKKDAYGHIDVC